MIIISVLCITAYGQPIISGNGDSGRFQSVGGDFGKSWINDFTAQNQKPAKEDLKNDLWSWGSAPRGKSMVDGKLVDTSRNLTSQINYTVNWLGDMSGTKPIYMNSSSPYGNYGMDAKGYLNQAPLTPFALSDDPWILAQQLERPVVTPEAGYYTPYSL